MIAPASNVGLKPGPTGGNIERPAKEPTTTTTMSVLTCTLCAVEVAGRQKHHTSKADLPQQPAKKPKLYKKHDQKGGCAENTVFSNLCKTHTGVCHAARACDALPFGF